MPARRTRGRPTKYRPEFARQARGAAELGAIDEEIAGVFGVCVTTINTWKRKHPEFRRELAAGKLIADASVAEALYQLGVGYSHDAVKILEHEGKPIVVHYVKRYPPDTKACIFWLVHRCPERWRNHFL